MVLLALQDSIDKQDSLGKTPLHWAAGRGTKEMIELLVVEYKADVFIRDGKGKTAFDCAKPAVKHIILQAMKASKNN